MSDLLHLHDVRVSYPSADAVRGVSLSVRRGECLAIVGESGSGKTQLFLACLGLLSPAARVDGRAELEGRNLFECSERELRAIRGARVAMIFQDALSALTPHLTIGTQMIEALQAHRRASKREALHRAAELLERVLVPDAAQRLRQYPHELSGGLRQRVLIAMALMSDPTLLIADEPTTALDVSVQAQIIDVLRGLREEGRTLVLITHDLGVVAALADRVAVMRAGELVESSEVHALFSDPRHEYTRRLLAAVPKWDRAASIRSE